jgi:hypothetical protein
MQSKMHNEGVERGWVRTISKEDPTYTSRKQEGDIISPRTSLFRTLLSLFSKLDVAHRLEFTLL